VGGRDDTRRGEALRWAPGPGHTGRTQRGARRHRPGPVPAAPCRPVPIGRRGTAGV